MMTFFKKLIHKLFHVHDWEVVEREWIDDMDPFYDDFDFYANCLHKKVCLTCGEIEDQIDQHRKQVEESKAIKKLRQEQAAAIENESS